MGQNESTQHMNSRWPNSEAQVLRQAAQWWQRVKLGPAPAAQKAGDKREKRMQGDDDAESMMKKLEDLYGQKQGRAEKPVPFNEVADFMKRVRRKREKDASKHVDYASDTIIKLVKKMENK